MPEASKAVFLSYASQDAEAARRMCEALRSGGVEVWFDVDGGLEHGDEWDAKIRKQIKECVLFIPIISANTQARHEGYFRIEWELAAQRAMGIASGVAFILPVVIDDTREPDALVPDRFRAVQWTKLPGGVVPPEVKARYLKLWSQRVGAAKADANVGRGLPTPPSGLSFAEASRSGDPALQLLAGRSRFKWLGGAAAAVIVLLAVGLVVFQGRKSGSPPPEAAHRIAKPEASAAPTSEVDRLVRQARELIYDPDSARNEFALAEGYLKRATDLAPDSAPAWGASALLNHYYMMRAYDVAREARMARSREEADKALRLDPKCVDALLALGSHRMVLEGPERARPFLDQARALDPTNPRILLAQSWLLSDFREQKKFMIAAAARTPQPAELLYYAATASLPMKEIDEAAALLDRAIQARPFWRAYVYRAFVEYVATANPDRMSAYLARVPELRRDEPRVVMLRWRIAMLRGDGPAAIQAVSSVATEFLEDNFISGPRAFLLAQARERANQPARADDEWETAARMLREKLKDKPGDPLWRAMLAVSLTRANAAEARSLADACRSDDRLDGPTRGANRWREVDAMEYLAQAYTRLGDATAAVDMLRRNLTGGGDLGLTGAVLAAEERWQSLRGRPDFEALLATAKPAGATVPDTKSVAVLAFENVGRDPANEGLAEGMSDELLNALGKIPGLKVIARTSAFSFKGKDTPIPEIAQRLGVAHVVEGSVRKDGTQVRISARLISGASGVQLWAGDFREELKDTFALQDKIAGLIASALQLKLVPADATTTVNPDAYQHLLQARFYSRGDTNDGWRRSIEECKAAIALDQNLAPAWAEMARCYIQLARFSGMGLTEAFAGARPAAERALLLAPDLAEAQNAMGWVRRTADWDWRRAGDSFKRAYDLAPRNAGIISDYAIILNNTGRFAEAIELGRRALDLDPLNASTRAHLSLFLGWAGRYDEAVTEVRRAIAFAPAATEWHAYLARFELLRGNVEAAAAAAEAEVSERYRLVLRALVLVARKDRAAADRVIQQVIEEYGDREAGYIAEYYAWAGERDLAFTWLERARERRETIVIWLLGQRTFDGIHADPRWAAFVRKVGLAEDQLK